MNQESKLRRLPHPLILIFAMIVIAQVFTYVLPPGTYDREDRKVQVGTYQSVEAKPLPWHAALTLIPKGMEKAADVIFFVFIIGGVIQVLRATGAIDALIGASIRRLGSNPLYLVAGMTVLCSLGSTSVGMAEEYMPFIPILVTMCIALKMDAIVAMGIVYVGAAIGYGCAALNPFTVLIAQDIAGLPLTSGQGFRWVLLIVCLFVGIHHLMAYASRIRSQPGQSLVSDVDYSRGFEIPEDTRFTTRRVIVMAIFAVGIALFVIGVARWEWYLTELSAVFMGTAILSAIAARLSFNVGAEAFCKGAADMTTTALLIGFARTIETVLTEGQVIDTIIHDIAGTLEGGSASIAAVGMLGVQSICNLLIPSGSGQAYVTMPIMAPLADLTGITRQTAVLAYQLGDGFMNAVVPTNALLMGMLALGKIPYQRWLRFVLPLMAKLYVVAIIALVIAVKIGYK
ncbi:AbgT family transporter [bacterium]|jgi:uncharacterized ion transporter superfamily protein YfcC|nr:AbgT family transporter [bacterium]MDA7644792.1 AbgT family transporter [bacterium]